MSLDRMAERLHFSPSSNRLTTNLYRVAVLSFSYSPDQKPEPKPNNTTAKRPSTPISLQKPFSKSLYKGLSISSNGPCGTDPIAAEGKNGA